MHQAKLMQSRVTVYNKDNVAAFSQMSCEWNAIVVMSQYACMAILSLGLG